MADLLVLNTSNWEHLIYRLGCHQMIISHVIKHGKRVYNKEKIVLLKDREKILEACF